MSSGGGKGGGGSDPSAMLEYGQKALDLQERMYDEGVARSQPYYQAGTTGLNSLMQRMGLGGTTNKTAQDYKNELASSYTTGGSAGGGGGLGDVKFTTTFGGIKNPTLSAEQKTALETYRPDLLQATSSNGGHGSQLSNNSKRNQDITSFLKNYGGGQSGTVDNTGLDAAVQQALADQTTANAAVTSDPTYGSLLQNFGMDQYQEDPGYQFRLSEGNKALERSLAAKGQFGSMNPAAAKALQEYGQQSASQEYGNAYDRYNNDQTNIYNRLAGIAGIGQTTNQQMQQAGQQYAASAGDLYTGMGNSIVAANQANQANKGSMFGSLLNAGTSLGSAWLMSDKNLKENIKSVGFENGYPIYEFTYKGKPDAKFIGVMAQEVEKITPEAVGEIDGHKAVNYDMIGVKFREVH